jgi:two-component sensor histidine kinase
VIQSIAAKTFSDTSDTRASRLAFEGRLMALASAHDLLTSESWGSAKIREVIKTTLRPFAAEHRLDVSGTDLRVRPQAAVSLSLALHELATNAAKYGALSNDAGAVTIRWKVTKGDLPMFQLVWREHGGPAVIPPTRTGFGSRLIRQGLSGELGGPVTLDYAQDGIVCTVEVPVANLQAE